MDRENFPELTPIYCKKARLRKIFSRITHASRQQVFLPQRPLSGHGIDCRAARNEPAIFSKGDQTAADKIFRAI